MTVKRLEYIETKWFTFSFSHLCFLSVFFAYLFNDKAEDGSFEQIITLAYKSLIGGRIIAEIIFIFLIYPVVENIAQPEVQAPTN